jgi:hypothetical protein
MRPLKSALLACAACLSFLAGCGDNGPKVESSPTGSFSNANLKGAYAFLVSGQNSSGNFSIAGTLTADGNGNLTGIQDENSAGLVSSNVSLTGTYKVNADGRGTATLTSSIGNFNYDFVIVSASRAFLIRFDTFATASGTMDLQDPSAFSAVALSGPFAFGVSGIDANNRLLQAVGDFTADGVGTLANGISDFNDSGATVNSALAGTYTVGSNGRGTLSLTTSIASYNFAFYVVNSNHIKMVETDALPMLAGDAFRQQGPASNALLSGAFAFTVAGGSTGPFAAGGVFSADGNGNLTSGIQDINDGGSTSLNLSTTGSYSIAANGRGTLTFNNSAGSTQYAIYPSSGGLLMLSLNHNVLLGTALAQTTTSLPQGSFGLNFSAQNSAGELDANAQFTANSNGSFTGAIDMNNVGSLSQSFALNGTFAAPAGGRGNLTWSSSAQTVNAIYYPVSATDGLILEVDNQQAGIGQYQAQQ